MAYLGIGSYEAMVGKAYDDLPPADRKALEGASVLTVRDAATADLLAPLSPTLLPCPALFAAHSESLRREKTKVALSMQGSREGNGQPLSQPVFDYTQALFNALADRYDCALICHYADELWELAPVFESRLPILYSYDPKDYAALYGDFDLTVTTRVHGAGLAASLGMPSLLLKHSTRSDTAEGFLSEVVAVPETPQEAVLARIDALPLAERSAALLDHKAQARAASLEALRPLIQALT